MVMSTSCELLSVIRLVGILLVTEDIFISDREAGCVVEVERRAEIGVVRVCGFGKRRGDPSDVI